VPGRRGKGDGVEVVVRMVHSHMSARDGRKSIGPGGRGEIT